MLSFLEVFFIVLKILLNYIFLSLSPYIYIYTLSLTGKEEVLLSSLLFLFLFPIFSQQTTKNSSDALDCKQVEIKKNKEVCACKWLLGNSAAILLPLLCLFLNLIFSTTVFLFFSSIYFIYSQFI